MRIPRSGSLLRVWLSALAGLCAASSAGALEIVVPPSLGDVEGNSNLSSGITSAATSQRYQQIYESSYFGALPGPILIESMAFRPDAQTGRAFAETVPSIQFNMSTTSLNVDTLSANFSANVGADDTILFFNQRLFLSSSFSGPASGPKDFDVVVQFPTPFLYDPAMGNLLLDVRLFDGDGPFMSQLDSHDDASDGIARVFTQSSNENGVTATFGTKLTDGYVTRFGYTVVPEPSTGALLGVALVSLSIARRGRRTRRSAEAGSGRTLER